MNVNNGSKEDDGEDGPVSSENPETEVKDLDGGDSNPRPYTRLTNTPTATEKSSKTVKFESEPSMAELTIQRYNTRASLFTREAPRTPEHCLAYDPCRLPETPLDHQPRTLYLLSSTQSSARAPPIKAWRGYGGNVYFEPVNLRKAPLSSRHSTALQIYDSANQNLMRRNSLSDKFSSYYSQHHNYSYRLPKSVAPVYYDSSTVEELDGKLGKALKNWAGEERKWMRGLQSTGSLKLPDSISSITRQSRAAGSTSVNFRTASEALNRSSRKRYQMRNSAASNSEQMSNHSLSLTA